MTPLAVLADAHVLPGEPGSWLYVESLVRQLPRPCRVLSLGDFFDFWYRGTAGHQGDYGPLLDLIRGSGLEWHFLHGNRDFMFTQDDARALGATLHPEPLRWDLGAEVGTFIHGDLLLTADSSYLRFRRWIRQGWVTSLSRTLPRAIVDAVVGLIRGKSDQGKALKPLDRFEVDLKEASRILGASSILMCGHTHKPLETALPGGGHLRILPAFGSAGEYLFWDPVQGWSPRRIT